MTKETKRKNVRGGDAGVPHVNRAYPFGIAVKGPNIVLDPLEGKLLVKDAVDSKGAGLVLELGQ